MTFGRVLVFWSGLSLAWLLALQASADLYVCLKQNGSKSFVQKRIEGAECRLLEKDGPTKSAKKPKASPSNKGANFKNLPVVSEGEQQSRDNVRKLILQKELQTEKLKYGIAQKQIAELKQKANTTPEVLDFLQRRLRSHLQNIKSLRQEIARTE